MGQEKIVTIRKRLEEAKGKRNAVAEWISAESDGFRKMRQEAHYSTEAQMVLQEAARLTQSQVQYRIGQLVTLALESVFDDPYTFDLQFDASRSKTAATLIFKRDGNNISPLDASAGGSVDVAAFGLQVSLWTLQTPRSAPVLILDEPLKWLKGGDYPAKGAQMIREISHRLGLQVIMVSHIPEQVDHADRVFLAVKKGNATHVREEK